MSRCTANFSASRRCSNKRRIRPTRIALEETRCIEVDRHDIQVLMERKPHAGMDMLTVLGRQFHAVAAARAFARQPQSQ